MNTILRRESRMPSLAGDRVAGLRAADAGRSPRTRRPDRLRHVHLHQLAAHAPVRARLGGKYREQGLVVVGIQTPEFEFEQNLDSVRASGGEGQRTRLAGGRRQPLRDLAGVEQPLLARPVLRRPRRSHSPPPLRRRAVRTVRASDPTAAGSRAAGPGDRRRRRRRGRGRLGAPEQPGDVPGLRAHRQLRITGRRRAREARVYAAPDRLRLNRWALRRLDDGARAR